jgi:AraC-like DNA-binding protein
MHITLTFGLLFWLTALHGNNLHTANPIFRKLDSLLSVCQYKETSTEIEHTLKNFPNLNHADKAGLYLRLSELQISFGDGEAALETGLLALTAALKTNSPLLVAETRINLIRANQILGKGLENLEFILESLELAQKYNHTRLRRNIYLIFGMQHFISNEFNDALKYFHLALNISASSPMPGLITHDQLMIGVAHLPKGHVDSSYWYIHRVKKSASANNDSMTLAKALLAEAYVDLVMGNLSDSKKHIETSLGISKSINLPLIYASGITQQMKISMASKDYQTAITLGEKVLGTFPENAHYYVKSYIDSLMYASYLEIKDYRHAHDYLLSFVNNEQKFNTRFQSYQSKQIELIQKTREQDLTIKNQALLLLSEKRKTSFIIVLNILFITVLTVIVIIQIINNHHIRSLFRKEQLISELMDETAHNRSLLVQYQPIPAANESNEPEDIPTDIDLLHRKILYEQLLSLLEKEKLYLNPELNRSSIITLLGTNKKYLHQATKYIGKTHLNHILNRYRIREAKKIIESHCARGSLNLPDDIFMQAGFNSKSSYYRIFKEFTGMTPKDYAHEFIKNNLE